VDHRWHSRRPRARGAVCLQQFNSEEKPTGRIKGYATHEREAFENVTAARARALGAGTPAEQAQAENQLTTTLKTLFAVSENYPELKANTNFLELQRELSDSENKIQAARRFYNTMVRDYNTALQTVPTNIIANLFSFKEREFFEVEDETVRSVPKVDFSAGSRNKE
jgi:LemA protein